MSSSRNWIFVINNWSLTDIVSIAQWPFRYVVYGKEIGDSNTPHLQGYVVFHTMQRLAAVKRLSPRAHWEVARGSTEQNKAYCTKDGDFTELGEEPITKAASGRAEKERWEAARDAARRGDLEAVDADIYLRHYRALKEIAKDHMVKPNDADNVTGIWYYGPPGTGKSRTARLDYPGAYDKMQNKWWDGYQSELYVIIDDFDSKELGHHLKIWGDRYSFLAETKGGAINIRPEKIVITSNYSIEELFADNPTLIAALKRRFTCKHFGEDHIFNTFI